MSKKSERDIKEILDSEPQNIEQDREKFAKLANSVWAKQHRNIESKKTQGNSGSLLQIYELTWQPFCRVSVSTPSGASPEGDGLMTTTPWDVYDYFYDEDRDFNADVLQAMRKRDQVIVFRF